MVKKGDIAFGLEQIVIILIVLILLIVVFIFLKEYFGPLKEALFKMLTLE